MTVTHGIWLFLAAYLATVVVLLFVGLQRSLRLRDLLVPALMVLTFRAVAWLVEGTCDTWDVAGLGLVVTLLASALVGSRLWLVHTTEELLATEVVDACMRIRIVCQQSSRVEVKLLLKTQTAQIRMRRLADGLQLLILPQVPDAKFKLFAVLLRKRYPPVWPRLTISLFRSKE